MFGALKTAFDLAKKVAPAAEGVKNIIGAAVDSRTDIERLYDSFKKKHDTDKDGKSDWTNEEIFDFVVEVARMVLKRL